MARTIAVALSVAAVACSDPVREHPRCHIDDLPLAGASAAPTVTSVSLEVQESGIVVLATATDPQGSDNLRGVTQSIGVYPDELCVGTPLIVTDDLSGSGVEESFGTVVNAQEQAALYSTISAADMWPVEVDFRDADGNRTSGRVLANVID